MTRYVAGEWLSQCKAMTGEDIIAQYLVPAVDHASGQLKGEAHSSIGKFYLQLHVVLKERMNSIEWKHGKTFES